MTNLDINTILELSCGSGEFINSIISVFYKNNSNIPKIDDIEYIYNQIQTINWGKGIPISIYNNDYLENGNNQS